MRRHQSRWRAEVLGLPYGTGPTPTSTARYGNMLTTPDAERGANFLTPQIFDVVRRRLAEGPGVERFRCLHNLLSSQPMCFNLFGPLVDDPALAGRLLAALLPGVTAVDELRIEWAPEPRNDYLSDRTAFDAFARCRRGDGSSIALGVETKLSEPFSPLVTNLDRYRAVAASMPEVWRTDRLGELGDPRWFQLLRNHLLVELVAARTGAEGWLAVVGHPEDPDLWDAVAAYRRVLVDRGPRLASWPLDEVVARWRAAADPADVPTARWLEAFAHRYVDLPPEG
jgi:hypothetical protein